jgi:hypothetical protein
MPSKLLIAAAEVAHAVAHAGALRRHGRACASTAGP